MNAASDIAQNAKTTTGEVEPPIRIGWVVALNGHPFFNDKNQDRIYISGEASMMSPLMVVTEVVMERRSSFDEGTGFQHADKSTCQCKCVWFSLKSSQFENAWISSKCLKVVTGSENCSGEAKFTSGHTVVLKTSSIEHGKKKRSLKQFGNENNSNTITALLSFCSPPMIVVGYTKGDSKEPLIDSKTGLRKRWVSEQLVKCKFFNSVTDKFSEFVFPREALVSIPPVKSTQISLLEEKISDRQLLEIKQDDREFPRSIIMPLKIVYKGGFYYLESKDYLLNKIIEVPITGVGEAYEGEAKIVQSLPRFDETGGKHLRFYSVNKIELEKLDSGKFWRIKYKDFHDNVSQRTIYNCSFLLSKETNAEGDAVDVDYIKANCLLRNKEERFFRIDRIQAIEVLGLEVTPVLK